MVMSRIVGCQRLSVTLGAVATGFGRIDAETRFNALFAEVLAGVATVSGGLGLDGPTPAAASIEDVAAASLDATRGSGRATVAYEEDWAGGVPMSGEIVFSGSDVDMALHRNGESTGLPNRPTRETQYRIVDGKLYVRHGTDPWVHNDLRDDQRNDLPGFDHRTVLDVLQPEAGFTAVGDEDLDGRSVRHLRAAHPEVLYDVLSDLDFGLGELHPDELVGLDVWVGLDDDVVYRLDLDVNRPATCRWSSTSPRASRARRAPSCY